MRIKPRHRRLGRQRIRQAVVYSVGRPEEHYAGYGQQNSAKNIFKRFIATSGQRSHYDPQHRLGNRRLTAVKLTRFALAGARAAEAGEDNTAKDVATAINSTTSGV